MDLRTTRIHIRKFVPRDWLAVHTYASDEQVMAYMPSGALSETDTKKLVNQHCGNSAEKFALILKEENRLIGHIEFFPYFGAHTYEIGWVLDPAYHGCGYATEAAKAVIAYGFSEMKLHRIIATCQPENRSSWRVMEKVGMRREGMFKQCIPHGDHWWDEYSYAILAEEWG